MTEKNVVICFNQEFISKSIAYYINSQRGWKVIKELKGSSLNSQDALVCLDCDLVLVDANLPPSEMESLKNVVKVCAMKIVFLCDFSQNLDMSLVLPFRAQGYLSKDISPREFLESLESISRGDIVVSPALVPKMVSTATDLANQQKLPQKDITPREKEIIGLLVQGHTNKQIAQNLTISENTVKNHVHNILDKLKLKNRANLVSFALASGLVEKSCILGMIFFCLCL